MSIAGHVSRAMLSRYSHIRTEAKRKALEDVERKRAAAKGPHERRKPQAGGRCASADPTPPAIVDHLPSTVTERCGWMTRELKIQTLGTDNPIWTGL
jgi:hypothetical protein